jgi:hypothetical protein
MDPAVGRLLANVERELAAAQEENRDLRMRNDSLDFATQALNDRLQDAQTDLVTERRLRGYVERDRDRARYDLVRAGERDSTIGVEPEHQGVWTRGRPYLTDQHVHHPETGACYVAFDGGVMPGLRPGRSRRWRLCGPDDDCPKPDPVSTKPHPIGFALRQHPLTREHICWWDTNRHRLAVDGREPGAVEDDHLLSIIVWLHEDATLAALWGSEMRRTPQAVPCPPDAYKLPSLWLADCPLLALLQAEKRRRGLRITERIKEQVRARENRLRN